IGAAISFFTTTFLVNVLRLIEVNKLFRIQPFNWKYMKLLLNFLIAGLVSFYFIDYLSIDQYSTLILSFITFALIYFLLFFALKCYSKEDLEVLNAIKTKLGSYRDKYF
ncbi:MAG: polysaccharide biosynthesis C-terminal domain-containing protein, partial [Nanoarchaeota archaeon]